MTHSFEPAGYGSVIVGLLSPIRIAALGPGKANSAVQAFLARFDPRSDLGQPVLDQAMALACHAGLWLYHDFLDESHIISQDLHTTEGSYWHAIMHRREPDAGNAKYWWRRVGTHPIFPKLAADAASLGYGESSATWDPYAFVDACEESRGSGNETEEILKRVQLREWQLLFVYCYQRAVSPRTLS